LNAYAIVYTRPVCSEMISKNRSGMKGLYMKSLTPACSACSFTLSTMLAVRAMIGMSGLIDLIAAMEAQENMVARTPGESFVEGMGLAIYRAVATYLEDHRHELVAAALMENQVAE